MSSINKILITFFLLFFSFFTKAQLFRNTQPILYFSPNITIGYTFRCGWNYGINLTLGYRKIQNTFPPTVLALSTQFYMINYQGEHHNIIAFNLVADNKISQFGAGVGRIWKTWGYKRVNKDAALGYSLVFNLGVNNYQYPWLGVKAFVPTAKWTWSSLPYYVSYYTFWRQQPFMIH